MKTYQSGINTLHVSNAIIREFRRLESFKRWDSNTLANYLSKIAYERLGCVEDFDNIPRFQDFCRETTGKGDDFRVGILNAHGTYLFGEWCYKDGIFRGSVQKWIDQNEKNYDLLLLEVCNPKNRKPKVKKSMAVVPTDDVSSYLTHVCDIEHLLIMPDGRELSLNHNTRSKLYESYVEAE